MSLQQPVLDESRLSVSSLAGFMLCTLSLLAALGGLRIVGLAVFAVDFGYSPWELCVIPFSALGIYLCRKQVGQTATRLQRSGTIVGTLAIIIVIAIAALSRWGFALSSGSFP